MDEPTIFFDLINRQNAFEAASTNFKLDKKGLLEGSQDSYAARELPFLIARSRHAIRNNGWAAAALNSFKTNMSTIGITWKDEKGRTHKVMQKLWEEFTKNPSWDGRGTFNTFQDTTNSIFFSDGEVIARTTIKKRRNITVPLALQLIDTSFLPPGYYDYTNNIRNGIQFVDGTPSAYYFMKGFNDEIFPTPSVKPISVDASEIIHCFIRNRANQWRGIPFLAPVLISLYLLEDLADAVVHKQISSSSLSMFVKNSNNNAAASVGTTMSRLVPTFSNDPKDPVIKEIKIAESQSSGVIYLNDGEEIQSFQGEDVGDNLHKLIRTELLKVAKTSYTTYESLTGDLTGISFSGIKGSNLELQKGISHIQKIYMIDLILRPICYKFQQLAEIYSDKRVLNAVPNFELPEFESIDQLDRLKTKVLELQAGLGSYSEELGRRLLTPEQIQEDRKLLADMQLLLLLQNTNNSLNQNTNIQANSNSSS